MAEPDGSVTGFLGRVEFQVKSPMKSSPIARLLILATAIFSVLGFALSPAQAEDSEYALRIQVKDQGRTAALKNPCDDQCFVARVTESQTNINQY